MFSLPTTVQVSGRVVPVRTDFRVILEIFVMLEDLAAWAEENPPQEGRARITGLPEFSSRGSSGTEDFTVTFTLGSEELSG